MNFFNDDIVHALQNAIGSSMNSATDRRSSLQPEAKHQNKEATVKRNLNDTLKVSNAEILAFSYVRKLPQKVQLGLLRRSRSFKVTEFGTN